MDGKPQIIISVSWRKEDLSHENFIFLMPLVNGILEFDEVKLLTELGHNVFCMGDYGGNERPIIYGRSKCDWLNSTEINEMRSRGQGSLPDFAIERCDAIICMHISNWLIDQWDRIKKKKCFLRLIGQQSAGLGERLRRLTDEGLKVIPYWPSDNHYNDLKADQTTGVVRFYKDENEFKDWNGKREIVLTACNDIMRGGGHACHAEIYNEVTEDMPKLLVGKNNRFFGDFTARVPFWMLKELYQECRVYFYLGTDPATYTLNLIEAMMTGCPVIAYDNGRGVKGIVPFASNDPDELAGQIELVLRRPAGHVSRFFCREKAIELFGKQQALTSWTKVLS